MRECKCGGKWELKREHPANKDSNNPGSSVYECNKCGEQLQTVRLELIHKGGKKPVGYKIYAAPVFEGDK